MLPKIRLMWDPPVFWGQWTTRRIHAWCCLICQLLLTQQTTASSCTVWRTILESGESLPWIESYLTNQSQRVVIGEAKTTGAKLENTSLKFGVPQGSVLGPILFTLYTCPLGQICTKYRYIFTYLCQGCGFESRSALHFLSLKFTLRKLFIIMYQICSLPSLCRQPADLPVSNLGLPECSQLKKTVFSS